MKTTDNNSNSIELKRAENEILESKKNLKTYKALAEISSRLVAASDVITDITDITLKYAKSLTNSKHGYASIIDGETGDNVSHTISQMMGRECLVTGKDKRIAFPADSDGHYPKLWGHALNTRRAFYTNAPQSHPSSEGTPPGHIPIENFLSVPALLGDRLVGQIALANSKGGFSDNDLEMVRQLANLFAIAVGRKETEDNLLESEAKYRTLISNILGMTYRGRSDWSTEIVGNSESICGYTPDEFNSGQVNWLDLIHPEDSSRVFNESSRLDQKPSELIQQYRIIAKDGSVHWVQDCKRSFFVKGVFRGVVGIVTDISEQKRMERHLIQAQKMEAIGTLAGGIAHDFNNILSVIIGFTELAVDGVKGGDSLVESNLQDVLEACRRATELVRQILTFSRQHDQEQKTIEVRHIAKEVLKLMRASLPTTIEIQDSLESKSTIEADPTEIHQVLMNLCTNAGHAMREEGGILKVTLADTVLDFDYCSRVSNLTPGPYVKLTVSDTGCGMSTHVLERIFDPFFTTKANGEGTGMGLSVVHGIVTSHDGTITVYSQPGKGTAFNVFLPIYETGIAPREARENHIPTGTERILFVDDEKMLARMGGQLLTSLGYGVTTMTSSIEALKLFMASPYQFDLVITDMTMPNMTGDQPRDGQG